MHLRTLHDGEEAVLLALFFNTIRRINIRDYTQEQVEGWAPDNLDPGSWVDKMRSIRPFVVEADGIIVGYSDLQPDGLVDHFFVHHQWQRRGVGRMLMGEIERRAEEAGIPSLESHVSITARPFFEAFGFRVVREQQTEMHGVEMTNYFMKRQMGCD